MMLSLFAFAEIVWPAIVICVPGGRVEVPIIMPPFEALVTLWPPISTGACSGVGVWRTAPALVARVWVVPSTTMLALFGAAEIVWPSTVVVEPGARVELPISIAPFEARAIV